MGKKATNAEIEQRVNEIYTLLLQSEPREKIVQDRSKKWGITHRQVDGYIAKAKARMSEDLEQDRQEHLNTAIAQRKDLYRQAYKAKKWFTCLQIADSRDKLLGLEFSVEDHVRAAIAAGYTVSEPGTNTEDESEATEQAAQAFFPGDDIDTAHSTADSISQE